MLISQEFITKAEKLLWFLHFDRSSRVVACYYDVFGSFANVQVSGSQAFPGNEWWNMLFLSLDYSLNRGKKSDQLGKHGFISCFQKEESQLRLKSVMFLRLFWFLPCSPYLVILRIFRVSNLGFKFLISGGNCSFSCKCE